MLVIQPSLEPIPGYRLIRRLGRGGCGEVWKAEAPGGVFKAIKFVFGELDGISQKTQSAEQEHKSLERVKNIRHPFILGTERFEIVDGQLIIVMELADGSLGDRFDECIANNLPGIPREELLRYMEEAAEALDVLNTTHQIQHLDVKPQNIFLVHQHVKVGDFGLAKNLDGTRASMTGGMTPVYAAPESFDGWVSRQSDQYSLAIVYMEMLTGKRPFPGPSPRQLVMQHLTAAPDLSALSPADRGPVDRALSKRPEDRFACCQDFVRALRAGASGSLPPGRKSDFTPRPSRASDAHTRLARRSAPAFVRSGAPSPLLGPEVAAPRPIAPTPRPGSGPRTRPGTLFPAVIVGVGPDGLEVIRQFRLLVADRYRSSNLPHIRCLYLDCYPSALNAAVGGTPDENLSSNDVFAAEVPAVDPACVELNAFTTDTKTTDDTSGSVGPLRSGRWVRATQNPAGDRVLPALLERLREALHDVSRPETLADAARRTQLEVRSKTPRVYVIAGLGDHFGSTVLVDLAYALKNELGTGGFNPEYLIGLLTIPGGDSPEAAERARQALTDLEYFDRGDTTYQSALGPGGPTASDSEHPFGRCLLFEGAPAVAHAAHMLFTETLTSAGQVLQSIKCLTPGHHYFAANVRRILWPRDAVLRGAARQLAHDLLVAWTTPQSAGTEHVERSVGQFWRETRLELGLIQAGLEYGASQRLGGPIESVLQEKLTSLGIGKEALDLISAEVAFNQLAEWLADSASPTARVAAAFAERGLEIAGETDLKLAPLVASLLERPGQRVFGAREALRALEKWLKEELAPADLEADAGVRELQAAYNGVRELLILPLQTGKSLYRKSAVPAGFGERITAWCQCAVRHIRNKSAADIYRRLLEAIPEFEREIEIVAGRLSALSSQVDTTPEAGLPADGVCEYLFPFGAETADETIAYLLNAIGDGGRREFDEIVQSKLRSSGKGVVQLGIRAEWGTRLIDLLVVEAGHFLESRTNRTSVSQALFKHFANPAELKLYVHELLEPPVNTLVASAAEVTLAGMPEDAVGNQIADLVRKTSPDATVLVFTSTDDFTVARLSGGLSPKTVRDHIDRCVVDGSLSELLPSTAG